MSLERIKTIIAALLGLAGLGITITVNVSIDRDVTPEAARYGWEAPSDQEQEQIAQLIPELQIVSSDGVPKSSEGAQVYLWDSVLRLNDGEHLPTWRQETGDCVSMGAANAVWYLQYVQAWSDPFYKGGLRRPFPPYIYGTSRTMPDLGNGRLGKGAGSVGGWAAEGVRKYGVLPADHEGVPKYSGAIADEWGYKGAPQKFVEYADDYQVKSVAKVIKYDQVRDAIANGYPVTVASNRGFKMRPKLHNGKMWGVPSGSWAHQMCFIGVDDQAVAPNGEKGACYCLNSWGPTAHGKPAGNEPPGGFWVDMRTVSQMVGRNDSYAYSTFDGFPAQDIDFNVFGAEPIEDIVKASNGHQGQGDSTMWTMFGLVLMAGGAGTYLVKKPIGTLTVVFLYAMMVLFSECQANEYSFDVFSAEPVKQVSSKGINFDVFCSCETMKGKARELCFGMFEDEKSESKPFGEEVVLQVVNVYKPKGEPCDPCKKLNTAEPELDATIVWHDYLPPGVTKYPYIEWTTEDGKRHSQTGWTDAASFNRMIERSKPVKNAKKPGKTAQNGPKSDPKKRAEAPPNGSS